MMMKFSPILPATAIIILAILSAGCGPEKTDDGKSSAGGRGGYGHPSPMPMPESVEVILEAETMAAEGCFVPVDDPKASGGKAMGVPQEETSMDGSLKTEIVLKAEASVTIWCRVRWDDTCSNSFLVILPNGMKKTVTGSTLKKWVWIAAAKRVPLKAGKHVLSILPREPGAQIDQLLIIDDDNRVPRGVATKLNDMAKE